MLLVYPLPNRRGCDYRFQFCWHDSEMWLENGEKLAKEKKTNNYCQTHIIKFS